MLWWTLCALIDVACAGQYPQPDDTQQPACMHEDEELLEANKGVIHVSVHMLQANTALYNGTWCMQLGGI